MIKALTFLATASAATAEAGTPLGGIPTVSIAPNVDMPLQGIGTWLYNETRAYSAVLRALTLKPTPYGKYIVRIWGFALRRCGIGWEGDRSF